MKFRLQYDSSEALYSQTKHWTNGGANLRIVSEEGRHVYTHRQILGLWSRHFSSLLAQPCFQDDGAMLTLHLPAGEVAIKGLLEVLQQEEVKDRTTDCLQEILSVAKVLGIPYKDWVCDGGQMMDVSNSGDSSSDFIDIFPTVIMEVSDSDIEEKYPVTETDLESSFVSDTSFPYPRKSQNRGKCGLCLNEATNKKDVNKSLNSCQSCNKSVCKGHAVLVCQRCSKNVKHKEEKKADENTATVDNATITVFPHSRTTLSSKRCKSCVRKGGISRDKIIKTKTACQACGEAMCGRHIVQCCQPCSEVLELSDGRDINEEEKDESADHNDMSTNGIEGLEYIPDAQTLVKVENEVNKNVKLEIDNKEKSECKDVVLGQISLQDVADNSVDICNPSPQDTCLECHKIHKPVNKHLSCNLCDDKFCNKKYLNRHKLRVHEMKPKGMRGQSNSPYDENNPLHCHLCRKAIDSETYQLYHTDTTHRPEKSEYYACRFCDHKTKAGYSLLEHLRSHTGEKPYNCDTCGMLFTSKKSLQTHIYIHEDNKSFKCDQCFKGFNQRASLLYHQKNHHKLDVEAITMEKAAKY